VTVLGDGIGALLMGLTGSGLIAMAGMAAWIVPAWRKMR